MSFIRKGPVDISRYLPAFLTKSPEMKANLDAESREHERIRAGLIDIAGQFNVKTAEWGLDLWENVYAILAEDPLEYENRRAVVLARMGPPPTVNEEFLTRLVNNFVADGSAKVLSYPAEYRVEFHFNGWQVKKYADLHKAIRTYIPAHLGYKLVADGVCPANLATIFVAAKLKTRRTVAVMPAEWSTVSTTDAFYIGIAMIEEDVVEMRG